VGSRSVDGVTGVPTPSTGDEVSWVVRHMGHLVCDDVAASPRFRGTQQAADAALGTLDVTGYVQRRNDVLPVSARGASGLSPWIRHGMLTLPIVWDRVADAPERDREKFRDELLWQEYARHVYARLGGRTADGLRHRLSGIAVTAPPGAADVDPWDRSMACIDATVTELERDGWLVNQTRMWLASQWSVRHGTDWRSGEQRFFTHLLDGSRAANRLGWQWTVGTGTGRPYGFSRWQVEKRAPGLCDRCEHRRACPIEHRPDDPPLREAPAEPMLRNDPDVAATAGPDGIEMTVGGAGDDTSGTVDAVWLTAESLGDGDPAMSAHPDSRVVFVFDEPLLARLHLSAKRLVFVAERLAELGTERDVEVHLGDPVDVLEGRRLATTFAPVPKWRRMAPRLDIVELHPWPWLRRPGNGTVQSFSAWRRTQGRA